MWQSWSFEKQILTLQVLQGKPPQGRVTNFCLLWQIIITNCIRSGLPCHGPGFGCSSGPRPTIWLSSQPGPPYPGDPNQFYDLNRDASEQGYAYYHVGHKEAHGPSAIDVSTNDRQQSPRELRPRAKKPAAVPDEQTDPATKPSDDDSDCLIVGVSVYGRESGKKPAARTKRKRAQPESGDGSGFEPSEHMSDTSESQTTNPSRSCASVSATANSSITSAGSLSFGGKPKASSDLPTRVIINPTLSFVTANGETIGGNVKRGHG